MTEIQFNSSGLVLNVIIDEAQVFAYGTRQPQLVIPLTFKTVRPIEKSSFKFEVVSLYADFSYRDGPKHEPLGASLPVLIAESAPNLTGVQMVLPLDHARLGQLESLRNGGDSFQLFLNVRLVFRKLRRLPSVEAFAHVAESAVTAQGTITIPKGAWCGRVLPDTGFGTILTLEFRTVPLEACAGLKNAVAALQKAQRLHRDGYYDKAVGECRVALDKFWDEKPKRLKDSWAVQLGEANHKWLGEALTVLRREGNDPHHNAIGKHFDFLESQLFISTTTALVAIVARSGASE